MPRIDRRRSDPTVEPRNGVDDVVTLSLDHAGDITVTIH
jgi:hypothetical protein